MTSRKGSDEQKRFSTLRAELAMHGFGLARTPAGDGPQRLYIERHGAAQPVASLDVAEAFLRRLPVRSVAAAPRS